MKVNRVATVAAGAVLAAGLSACGGEAAGGDGLEVSSTSFEEEGLIWPFWSESGTLHCDDGAVYFRSGDGGEYAVNGVAVESGRYADPASIRLDSQAPEEAEDGLGGQAPLEDMIAAGEELCD